MMWEYFSVKKMKRFPIHFLMEKDLIEPGVLFAGDVWLAAGWEQKILWTKKEVAGTLQVSTKTISRLINQGALPFIQIGSSIRIQKTDVFAFLES